MRLYATKRAELALTRVGRERQQDPRSQREIVPRSHRTASTNKLSFSRLSRATIPGCPLAVCWKAQ